MSAFENPALPQAGPAFSNRFADRRSIALAVQLLVMFAALHLLFLVDSTTLGVQWISRLLFLHFVWVMWSWWRLTGSLLDPYILFTLSASVFNGGLGLLEALYLSPGPMLEGFPVELRTRSLMLVFVALVALHFGALLALRRGGELGARVESSPLNDRALRIVGLGLLAVCIVPLSIQLKKGLSAAIEFGYLALYEGQVSAGGLDSALEIIADLVIPGTFFLCSGSKKSHFERRATLALFLTYCGSVLFAGARGSSMMPLVALVWLWDRTIARLPRSALIVAAAILLAVFPLIRETRELSAAERRTVSVKKTYSELGVHPLVDAVAEMGGSILPLLHTLELVPAYHDYEMGVGYLYDGLSLVPNLFWARHPTAVRGVPSIWLIENVDPGTAMSGGGLGYSFVAEAFLNFGAVGVPLVSLLLGFGVVRFWLWAETRGNPGRFAVVASLLPSLFFFARSEAVGLPRQLVWYGLLPYGAYLVVRRVLETRRGQTAA